MYRGYHGTDTEFTLSSMEPSAHGTFGSGYYFVGEAEEAKCYGEIVVCANLALQNPWLVQASWDSPKSTELDFECPCIEAVLTLPGGEALVCEAMDPSQEPPGMFGASLQNTLVSLGYDSILAQYPDGSREYVAFSAEQVRQPEPKPRPRGGVLSRSL